jgi:type II secretory pathway component GspD/PulD (secretin)
MKSAYTQFKRAILLALVISATSYSHAATELDAVLDKTVTRFSVVQGQTIRQTIEGIGLSFGVPVVVEEGVEGDVTLSVVNTDVRGLLNMVCRRGGYFWEVQPEGYILIRKTKTVLYTVDYPQNSRSSTETASVSLGGGNYNGGTGTNGVSGAGIGSSTVSAGANTGGGSDTTQVNVTGENRIEFWDKIEVQIKAMLGKGETVIVNKFAGLVEVNAGLASHARVSSFLQRMNRRIGRQIALEARILEVRLNDTSKLGIDWNVAAFTVGKSVNVGAPFAQGGAAPIISGLRGRTLNAVTSVADTSIPSPTFSGTLGVDKVGALVQALSQQGNVRSVSSPRISALNNQTAFIKIATQKTFWQQSNTTQIFGSSGTGTQPVVVGNYVPNSMSIGNFLRIVPQVTDDTNPADAVITLDVTPVITKESGETVSPDGKSNAPVLDVQQASTIVRVKNGESAIIGGFQNWLKGQTTSGVPGLSSLPVIGAAFRTDSKVDQLMELVIVITASVVDPGTSKPLDIDDVLRMKNSKEDNKINVPASSLPAPTQSVVTDPTGISNTKAGSQIIEVP